MSENANVTINIWKLILGIGSICAILVLALMGQVPWPLAAILWAIAVTALL